MLDVSTALAAKIAAASVAPIWLVELPTLSTYLATGSVPDRTLLVGEALCSPQTICGGQVSYAQAIAERGMGRLSVELDPLSNQTQRGNITVSVLGTIGRALRQSGRLTHAPVRVVLTFDGLSYSDSLPVFSGLVDNSQLSWQTLQLNVLDESFRLLKNLSTPIGGQYFKEAPQIHHGKSIAILLGRQQGIECPLVSSAAQGTLAEAMTDTVGHLYLQQLDATFPASGSLTIEAEACDYDTRLVTTKAGVSYLVLADLTRPSPVAHTAGALVSLAGVAWTYLVGYECSEVSTVYTADGAVIDPADYTVVLDAAGGDRPVTIIICDSYQGDTILVDASGLNVTPQTALSNGDFETGSLTGWTQGSGASAAVTSGNAVDGTYKAELTGGSGALKDLYQDLTLLPDRLYTIEWYYRDTLGGTNVLTNGDFETGALSPWTAQPMQFGLPGVGSLDAWAVSVVAGAGAQGSYGLQFTAANAFITAFEGSVYVDVATSIGATYSFTLSSRGMTWVASGGSATPLAYQISTVGWQLGTTTQPWSLANHPPGPTRPGEPVHYFNYGVTQQWSAHEVVPFTATATTTRITLSVYSNAVGGAPGNAPPLVIDNVSLVQVTNLPNSRSAYQLGTPADPDASAAATLDLQYGWTLASVTVRPSSTPLRLTLQSQWVHGATPSWFDAVRFYDSGRNPAEAIAYVIDTFLPGMSRNTESFDASYALLKDWQFGAFLPEPGDSKALLERMAAQCKSRIVFDAAGRASLRTFDAHATPLAALTTDTIAEDSLTVEGVSLDTLYSEIHVWYGLKTGADRDSPESYQDEVYATPAGTNHPTRNLAPRCQHAETTLRRSRRLDVYADMIRDAVTASSLLEHLVDRHTYQQDLVTLQTWYTQIPLEVGDPITVEHPLVQSSGAVACEVLAWRPDPAPGMVELLLETLRGMGLDDVPTTITPGDAAGDLALWLEADVGVTKDGSDHVSGWVETSVNAYALAQATSGYQPTWRASVAYTHPVVTFDAVDDVLQHGTALDFAGLSGATWFVVLRLSVLDNIGGLTKWILARDDAGNRGWALGHSSWVPWVLVSTPSGGFVQRDATVDLRNVVGDSDPMHLIVARYHGLAGTLDLWVDGVASNGTLTGTVPATIAGSGPALRLGASARATQYYQGDIAAVVVYGRALAPSEREGVEGHLLAKYGIV